VFAGVVAESAAMFELPAGRSAVRTRLRQAAMTCGAGRGADGGAVLVEGDVADPRPIAIYILVSVRGDRPRLALTETYDADA
jgi:hypothetical protein